MWLPLFLLLLAGVSHQKPLNINGNDTNIAFNESDSIFKLMALFSNHSGNGTLHRDETPAWYSDVGNFLSDALYKATFIQRYILNVYYQLYVDHLKQYEKPVLNVFKSFFENDKREKRADVMSVGPAVKTTSRHNLPTSSGPVVGQTTNGNKQTKSPVARKTTSKHIQNSGKKSSRPTVPRKTEGPIEKSLHRVIKSNFETVEGERHV